MLGCTSDAPAPTATEAPTPSVTTAPTPATTADRADGAQPTATATAARADGGTAQPTATATPTRAEGAVTRPTPTATATRDDGGTAQATATATPTRADGAAARPTATPTEAAGQAGGDRDGVSAPEPDRAALVALYEATDGANWSNSTNWLTDRSIGEWYGVTTDGDGRVTSLELTENQLSGPIPAELGSLSDLTVLNLPGETG